MKCQISDHATLVSHEHPIKDCQERHESNLSDVRPSACPLDDMKSLQLMSTLPALFEAIDAVLGNKRPTLKPQKSATMIEIPNTLKRQRHIEDEPQKKLKINAGLSTRLSRIEIDSPKLRRQSILQNRIKKLESEWSIPQQTAETKWMERKHELEKNLQLIRHPPQDSYDDVKTLVNAIWDCAQWLCEGDFAHLGLFVQDWKTCHEQFSIAARFVTLVEDMKQFIRSPPHLTHNIQSDSIALSSLLGSKRALYGDLLQSHGRVWRQRGFPVDDIMEVIQQFQLIIANLVWGHLTQVKQHMHSFSQDLTHWDKHLDVLLDVIRVIGESLHFFSQRHQVYQTIYSELSSLSVLFIKTSLQLANQYIGTHFDKKSRLNDSKICFYFQRILIVLQNNIPMQTDEDPLRMTPSSSRSSILEPMEQAPVNLIHESLVDIVVEAGLTFAEYVGHETKSKPAMAHYLSALLCKYGYLTAQVLRSLLTPEQIEHADALRQHFNDEDTLS